MTDDVPVEIRRAGISDFTGIYAIEVESYEYPWDEFIFLDEIEGNPRAEWIVATIDRKVVGFAGMWAKLHERHLVNIAVSKSYRRKRIATTMLDYLTRRAKDEKARYIMLEVESRNTGAISFYTKQGFRKMGAIEGYYEQEDDDALIMIKELDNNI
ncbi:MAG TPA: ribosomal protein S18-alanine N-acetyltransferase [Caldisericia bacterium]|nr:ribosomal protein S18-alanine N-acetyltransferase [Caldisericia bacterium]HPF48374.1 ribosomal protein S18-alanine N-acetyltransferase [Caldisericia bacterium]HPI83447.1 ribosomal protein S18-alanine N-acetyltransferase [Caldisericia bacterium]HPQ92828.1 ribosomal protein S18-alanine N-acetyltransferase [Caldisericia bacterium]HRV74075.1 ribosomal protein S18-alanine N-acetyltransferase [Caldisericia bacterium]